MSEGKPWWFSGDEPATDEPARSEAAPAGQPADTDGPGLADVIAGIGTLVGWAREQVIDPHLEHTDPAEYPDCVICRGMTVVQRIGEREEALADDALDADEVTWVPLTRKGRARKTTRNDKRGKGKGAASWG